MNTAGSSLYPARTNSSIYSLPLLTIVSIVTFLPMPARGLAAIQDSRKGPSDQQLTDNFNKKSPIELLNDYFKEPPYPIFAIRRIIDLGDPIVIPRLEQAFTRERHDPAREFIAAALVNLGDPEPAYYAYVAARAENSVMSDLPFPVQLGVRTQSSNGLPPLRKAFLSWVQQHGANLNDTLWLATFEEPSAVEALGEAADQRSRALLRRGLKSSDILVAVAAALGLARLQDAASVSSIIAAAKHRQNHEERRMLAKTLLYFPSLKAQHAAARFIEDPALLRRWRAEVAKRGWKRAMRDSDE